MGGPLSFSDILAQKRGDVTDCVTEMRLSNDCTLDVVIAGMMLYHIPDLPRALREVRRVLKENGIFSRAAYGEYGMMESGWRLKKDAQRNTLCL